MSIEQPLINRLMRYFFRGLLLIIPLGGTLYLISVVLRKIDGFVSLGIPGLGMCIVVASITLLGYIGTTLFVKSVFGFTEALIKKVPFIRALYSYLKDFTSAFVSSKGKFNKPVIILLNKTTQVYRIGFITKDALDVLSMPSHIAVYLPNAYDLAGVLVIVPPELVRPLDLPGSEVMKFNFSGGLTPLKNTGTKANTPDLDATA
ncbi:Putative uncharacterized protein [Cardinium endosymbiont cEper1 of Encarsia pergandiella]|uniref:DUF502 domain-containing protein n=1 Tax=Cardinium endosymbiont of Encarsia pergandiella TaxID=249402 RepID=UPI00027EAA20|nr:DUF502 domain-containing protein [Cardinium endosymbiont of Encarsia pergandiella]CCM10494.1 Putative uncharacterized protein [Cardinium endosymbiont cEper1 of Encarsia pergandiella]